MQASAATAYTATRASSCGADSGCGAEFDMGHRLKPVLPVHEGFFVVDFGAAFAGDFAGAAGAGEVILAVLMTSSLG